ncbi:MAG: hypothetical protein B6D72_03055 [gamma proteobacterium symbiont of Ctena orbiculata]|uniref:DUF5666 domain-containing protein n=1 Tax=Candidatus Thiodiazotropha taylori TaxID=2792791 RepID=A0A944M5R8_9GAMM|nr:hypothetical protein [Candidatus Thiodiazotropha taylori]PUB89460.1 MAG: hypothetical protein DBP00_02515 [gamma proteobacterium symbiont of Ctena orbiculata]MBT3027960.1 hypothetical protein [Candidatus Thiodiazotropha taylori]MBT3035572.1 hypothetical protein [Candidatus Thiodiazotropha taylori]PVV14852.1 MAG: hypothetical protein B6D72_03055 [gamma proteobacterium symbiont of Ctena orbiculata]
MNRRLLKILIWLAMVASIVGLYSCGPGGNQVADGGIGGTGITQGRVTSFGSIFVNGIEFNTDTASIMVNNLDATQDDLAIGMVVRISGSSDTTSATGSAESVTYDSLIEGLVNSNDIANNDTLRVMDQTVSVDGDTVFDNRIDDTSLENLPVNSKVEVSGFTDGSGIILATRIEVISLAWSGDELEVSGVISSISGDQFQIGSLTIDASNIESIPAVGTFVEVEGDSFSGGLFIADSIEIEGDGDRVVAEDGDEVEIEGQITQPLDANDLFSLNGQVVDASATSLNGAASQLTIGRVAKVEGVMNGDILLAEEITLKVIASERGKISGFLGIGNVDVSGGTLILLGRTIKVDNSTIMESDSGDNSSFSLDQLISSDYLEAKVYLENGMLVASKLELDGAPSNHNAEVEGIPTFVNASTIEIFGITIDTSAVSDYSFSEQLIEVRGNFANGVLVATRIQEED